MIQYILNINSIYSQIYGQDNISSFRFNAFYEDSMSHRDRDNVACGEIVQVLNQCLSSPVGFFKQSYSGELRFSTTTSFTESTSCACPGRENRSLAIRGFLSTRPVLVRPPFRVFRSKELVPESAHRKILGPVSVIRDRKSGVCYRRRKNYNVQPHVHTRVCIRQIRVICNSCAGNDGNSAEKVGRLIFNGQRGD